METNWLVEAGFEVPIWSVHDDDRRALIDTNDKAEAFVEPDNISTTQTERGIQGSPNDAELGLIRVNEVGLLASHDAQ